MLNFPNFTDLKPIEITEENIEQVISVRHNPVTGELKINYSRLDAFQALFLLGEAFYFIWKNHIKSATRPRFNSGKSKVCTQVDGDTMSMAFATESDGKAVPDVGTAKGILLAAWLGLCDKTSEGKFDPREAFAGMLEIRR